MKVSSKNEGKASLVYAHMSSNEREKNAKKRKGKSASIKPALWKE